MNTGMTDAQRLAIACAMAAVPPVEGRDFELMPTGSSEASEPLLEDGLTLKLAQAGVPPPARSQKNEGAFRPAVPACDDFSPRCSLPDAEPLLSSDRASWSDEGIADPLPPVGLPWNCRKVAGLRCPDDALQSSRSEDAAAAAACCIVLTETQRDHLSFAAMCQAEELEECEEADHPDVQEAIRSLWEARRLLEAGRPL